MGLVLLEHYGVTPYHFFFSMCGDKILIFGLIRKTLIVTLTILHGIKPKKQNEWSELSLLNLKPDLSTVSTSSIV